MLSKCYEFTYSSVYLLGTRVHDPSRQYGAPPVQAIELPHLHTLFAASHVSAASFPIPHVEAVPHKHTPETHVSPAVEHVTPPQGSVRR